MSNESGTKIADIKINTDNLYREESFTDLTFATIRRLTPIKIDGSIDESREANLYRDDPAYVPQWTDSCSVYY